MKLSWLFFVAKLSFTGVLVFILTIFLSKQTFAFSNVSDTLTTSRPSASSPLNANAISSDTQLTIFNNSSRFLASDSAKIVNSSSNAQISGGLNIASQSGGLTIVSLGNTVGASAVHGIDVLLMPITAVHVVKLVPSYQINASDTLTINFPALAAGDANNSASASASTFQLNGLSSSNIKVENNGVDVSANYTYTISNPSPGSPPTITLTQTAGTVAVGDVLKIYLGCTTISGSACTAQQPRIINPTKSASLGTGDQWKITILQGGSATDTVTISIATIESVTIHASIEPSLSFTIAGINSGAAINMGNSGCGLATTLNSGINSSENDVNLGLVQQTAAAGGALTNTAGQKLSVSTNGANGYSLTATASSALLNPATGFFFHSSTSPTNFSNSTMTPAHFYGLHPCGPDVNTSWIEGGASGGSTCGMVAGPDGGTANECFWAWPSANTQTSISPITIATAAVGPIGSGNGTAGSGITSVVYSAGADVTVPPGNYRTVITYTATPMF